MVLDFFSCYLVFFVLVVVGIVFGVFVVVLLVYFVYVYNGKGLEIVVDFVEDLVDVVVNIFIV